MALYFLQQTANYLIGIWKIEEEEQQLMIDSGVQEPPAYPNKFRRLEFLAVRALAMEMGISSSTIGYLTSGKPYLIDKGKSISISHTKGYVAVMLSSIEHIGVDLEHITDRIHNIRQKFMHPDEENRLRLIGQPAKETIGLLAHWCAKESLFKAVSEEGIDFSTELRIVDFQALNQHGRFKGEFTRTGKTFEIDYHIDPEFVLTCSFSTESK